MNKEIKKLMEYNILILWVDLAVKNGLETYKYGRKPVTLFHILRNIFNTT
jgi:hypothetical protein